MINLPPIDTIPLSIPAQEVLDGDANLRRYTQRLQSAVQELDGSSQVLTQDWLPLFLQARSQLASEIAMELQSLGFPSMVMGGWLQEILNPRWIANPTLAVVFVRVPEIAVLKMDFLDQIDRKDKNALLIRSIIGAVCAIGPFTIMYDLCSNRICDDYDTTNGYKMSLLPSSLVEVSRDKFQGRLTMPASEEAGISLLKSASISSELTETQKRWCAEIFDTLSFFKTNGIPRLTNRIFNPDNVPSLSDYFLLANDDDVLCFYLETVEPPSDDEFTFSYDIYAADDVRMLLRTSCHIRALQRLMECAGQVWLERTL